MLGKIRLSHIWNLAWDNKSVLQQQCFWGIWAGDIAQFWEDN